jgi:hypothetical protein
MTADECNERAARCAASADIAPNEFIALEFMTLAAQWRAMAVRRMFPGDADDPV